MIRAPLSTVTEEKPLRRLPAGNTATNWLKIIALVFMMCDHCGKIFFSRVPEMRMIGRIAFPIYIWCAVVGACYTRNMAKYILRVLLLGIAVQPLYMRALNHTWQEPNIFSTIFLGLTAIWGIQEKKYLSQITAPLAALCLATVLHVDYGWQGVLAFILFWAARDSRSGLAAVMVAYFLFWGSSYSPTAQIFGMPLHWEALPAFLAQPLRAFLRLETYGLLSMPFILIRFPQDLRYPRWVGYTLYPAHLLVIILIRVLTGV